ncbi:GNAT family N-acetyltransferase [Piscinibacter sakaiensis]|uniref:GNAT family N-acetyltransferase n=1 Tax=Piscinibacter sakaiensis TaxID=1547922 RepID=UPI003AAC4CDF
MLIRPESAADLSAIRALTARAFAGVPYSDGSEPGIVEGLRASHALAISLVADHEGTLVGHVAVSAVSISDNTSGWFGLGPISVEPSYQGRGIGSKLVHAALEELRGQGASGCVVLGDPAYYKRFGFIHEHDLKYPGPPAEYFMALEFGSSHPHGLVKYHAAFGGVA